MVVVNSPISIKNTNHLSDTVVRQILDIGGQAVVDHHRLDGSGEVIQTAVDNFDTVDLVVNFKKSIFPDQYRISDSFGNETNSEFVSSCCLFLKDNGYGKILDVEICEVREKYFIKSIDPIKNKAHFFESPDLKKTRDPFGGSRDFAAKYCNSPCKPRLA